MSNFDKTVTAFLAVEGSLWGIVEALEEELDVRGPRRYGDVIAMYGELTKAGVDVAYRTLRDYVTAAKTLAIATAEERSLIQRTSVATVVTLARAGYSSEGIAQMVADHHFRLTLADARRQVRKPRSEPTGPEDWGEPEWMKFDSEVLAALRTLATALNLRRRGDYKPSAHVEVMLTLIDPPEFDFDAELAALLAREE